MAVGEAELLRGRRTWRRHLRVAALAVVALAGAAMTLPQLAEDLSSPRLSPVAASSPTTAAPDLTAQAAAAARMAVAGAAAELDTLRRAADALAHGLADERAADHAARGAAAQDESAQQEAARQAASAAAIAAQSTTTSPAPRTMTPPTTASASPTAAAQSPAPANVDSGAEARFLALLNDARAQAGLPVLQVSSRLRATAEAWAAELANEGALRNHDLQPFMTSWTAVGENIAFGPSVDSMFKALMSSSQHYTNIAKPDYSSVGIGVVVGPDGKLWTCHIFAG